MCQWAVMRSMAGCALCTSQAQGSTDAGALHQTDVSQQDKQRLPPPLRLLHNGLLTVTWHGAYQMMSVILCTECMSRMRYLLHEDTVQNLVRSQSTNAKNFSQVDPDFPFVTISTWAGLLSPCHTHTSGKCATCWLVLALSVPSNDFLGFLFHADCDTFVCFFVSCQQLKSGSSYTSIWKVCPISFLLIHHHSCYDPCRCISQLVSWIPVQHL
jgi:hypothetical protein